MSPPQSDSTASPGMTITGYLMQVLNSLRDAGNAGPASVSWKFKLELLFAATATRADVQPARAAPQAVDKLGQTLASLA